MCKTVSGALCRFMLGGAAVFALSVCSTPQASAQQLRDIYHPVPRDTVSPSVYNGWKVFQLDCARCHGEEATGTSFAPNLLVSVGKEGLVNTQELFVATVCGGRKDKGMPSWCELGLEVPKMMDIYAYVRLRSDGKMGPGRPAVKTEGT